MLTIQEQLRVARAVSAQRRARMLAPDNTAGPLIPLEDAVTSGRAYFVVPRPDLLVVDADLPADPAAAADRLASFDLLIEAADRCGVPHVTVASGRPGHRHGYLVMPAGRARTVVEQWCRDRGLDVRDRGVRPPGAAHRGGDCQAVPLSPRTAPDIVEVLRAPLDADAAARLAHRLMPVHLPARIQSALRHGHAAAAYESPSHARMALAVAIRSRQGPKGLLEMLLADRSSPLGRTYRGRPGRWQQQELRRLWDKAGDWLRERPRVGPVAFLVDRYEVALAAHAWRGMAGGTDFAVAEAFAALARRVGSVTVGYALADLAVAAGVSQDTARSSARRLIAQGWLAVVAEATPRTSRVYRLCIPAAAAATTDSRAEASHGPAEETSSVLRDLGQDVARWRGLGKVTVRVARAVTRQSQGRAPLERTELVQRLGAQLFMRPAAVRYHLRKLDHHGVLEALLAGSPAARVGTLLAGIAQHLGVAGRRDAQALAVREQRAQRAVVLATYRAAWVDGRRSTQTTRALAKHDLLDAAQRRARAGATPRPVGAGVSAPSHVLTRPVIPALASA